MGIANRPGRYAALCACSLVLAAVLAGCSVLGTAFKTSADLQRVGFQNANVSITTGSGAPAHGIIRVSYRRGPSGDDQQDGREAARIVWDTLSYRFGVLVIAQRSGGCIGPVCGSKTEVVESATYTQLATAFGPRPRGLNVSRGASPFGIPGWVVALVVTVGIVVVAAAIVIAIIVIRRTRPPVTPPGPPVR